MKKTVALLLGLVLPYSGTFPVSWDGKSISFPNSEEE